MGPVRLGQSLSMIVSKVCIYVLAFYLVLVEGGKCRTGC